MFWPAAGADITLALLLHIFTGLLVACNYISSTATNYEILRDGYYFHRYAGDIFLFLRRSCWSGHVPEKYLPVITAAATAATAADNGDGALYWCCSILTAADAAPGAPAAAPYC